jgi:hypothetical protein
MSGGLVSFAQYRVRPGAEDRFKELLRRHTATLRSLEMITDRPVEVFLGAERDVEGPFFVEVFEWIDESAVSLAHTHPQVSVLWESIATMCEERGGRPMFEFRSLKPIDLG